MSTLPVVDIPVTAEPVLSSDEGGIVLKHDRLFLVATNSGDIVEGRDRHLGLFIDDTRILSRYVLRLQGSPCAVLSTQVPEVFRSQIDVAVGDRVFGGDPWDPRNVIHVRRQQLLDGDALIERLTLANHLTRPIDYTIELDLGSDFADMFEVRGWDRSGRGKVLEPVPHDRSLDLSYRGLDGLLVGTTIRFREPPDIVGPTGATWHFKLAANGTTSVEWEVVAWDEIQSAPPWKEDFDARCERMRATYSVWREECSRWHSDVPFFDRILGQAVNDLRSLYSRIHDTEVITAGIPWYSTVFGRDSIIASLQMLPLNRRVAVDTLRYLARFQGRKHDPFTEEEPGRIMHELRRGEMARAGEIPHIPYYGTIDATPLWLILLHETWRWTNDLALVREMMPHAERALAWLDSYGDLDGDGFIEYTQRSEKGLRHQGWKDSGDGVPLPDGGAPPPPIALVEVQGYVYDAKERMSALMKALGRLDDAERLKAESRVLCDRIQEYYWDEGLGSFALALDGNKQPVPTLTSNAGHLLWSRVPTPQQAAALCEKLLGPSMFSGWGIRTLAEAQPVFNPMSYHNGSIWPHDNALIMLGLSLYGFGRNTLPVIRAMYDAAANMDDYRLPELFCGMTRTGGMRPVLYPVSCSPQAWASGAFFMMLQGALGIFADAPRGILHIREPHLPTFLDRLTIEGLQVGRSHVSIEFRRRGDRTFANLLRVSGEPLHVWIELS